MKKVLLFLLPLLIIVAGAFAVIGVLQVRFQEERLLDDLARKAKNVAESMELSASQLLSKNDVKSAQRMADKFQKRERMQGCIFYNKDGKILAVTERISDIVTRDSKYVTDIVESGTPRDGQEKFREYSFYSYLMPVLDDNGGRLGAVEVVYDTSYVYKSLNEIWKRTTVILFLLITLIVSVVLLLQRQIFFLPVRRLTDWFSKFQKGETDESLGFKDPGDLGRLASEVEQVALGLRVARKTVAKEAAARIKKEDLWDENRLKDLVRAKLGENSLFLVSNREPYMHVQEEAKGKARCVRPASGVVTALDPVMRACGGEWIAQGSGNADRKFVNSKNKLGVPPEDIHYILKRIWLSKQEEKGFYYGFSNEGMWPLCHITFTRPEFRESDWTEYKRVNRKFADAVLEDLPAKNPFIFIQDYHFTLLARMIKDSRPDATIALFWHIPWPNPEVFSVCPYQEEILDGMLACDLLGFHVQYHCNNFLDTVNRTLECRIDAEKSNVIRNNKETAVRAFPISIDNLVYSNPGKGLVEDIEAIVKEHELEGKIVGVGVERIDYTKGIIERFNAIDRFLDKYPEYKGKFVFLQLASPSRTHIKRYHDLIAEIDEKVDKINWKHSDNGWKPIVYEKKHFSSDELKPYYALADICIVSSLHDGMNLVAKEYAASKNDLRGMLILSCFTGAARELVDAVQVNPYSTENFADAIRFAIEMPQDEKSKRMKNMRQIISDNNVYKWAGSIISELTALKK